MTHRPPLAMVSTTNTEKSYLDKFRADFPGHEFEWDAPFHTDSVRSRVLYIDNVRSTITNRHIIKEGQVVEHMDPLIYHYLRNSVEQWIQA